MNHAGYQEVFPNREHFTHMGKAVINRVKETCMLCSFFAPFGCEQCRKEIQHEESKLVDPPVSQDKPKIPPKPARIYIGSGEDMPEWSSGDDMQYA